MNEMSIAFQPAEFQHPYFSERVIIANLINN